MSWIALPIVAVVVAFLLQGVFLQVAVALTGEQAPRYGSALVTALLAGLVGWLAGGLFGWTAGLVLSAVAPGLAAALGFLVTWLSVAGVLRRRLGTGLLHALVVAGLQQLLSLLVLGGLGLVTRLLLGFLG